MKKLLLLTLFLCFLTGCPHPNPNGAMYDHPGGYEDPVPREGYPVSEKVYLNYENNRREMFVDGYSFEDDKYLCTWIGAERANRRWQAFYSYELTQGE